MSGHVAGGHCRSGPVLAARPRHDDQNSAEPDRKDSTTITILHLPAWVAHAPYVNHNVVYVFTKDHYSASRTIKGED
uniref:Uncharacterized protein n=1 Tax=Arundo donax TaxID=35708 RepID=A0A0A9GHF1_ARUDO